MAARHSDSRRTNRRLRWSLGAVGLLLTLVLPATSFVSDLPDLLATVTKPKPEQKPKRKPCCPIGVAYLAGGGKVTLTQICQTASRSVFHFKTERVNSACTHPNGTVLRDQAGRRYPMLRSAGLPDCSTGRFSMKPNLRFRWEFRKLQSGVRQITLLEVEDDVTAGLSFWAWRNVKVAHCQF